MTLLGYNCEILDNAKLSRYAVVILLPESLDLIVAPLRKRFDPDHNVIASHITVVFPFTTDKPLDVVSDIVRHAADSVPPLTIQLDSIGDFYPAFPLIYWSVKRHNLLDHLYRTLYADLNLALPHKYFNPHVTIAREISAHRVVLVKDQIAPYLFDDQLEARSIDLVAPLASGSWVSVRTFPLNGRSS